MDQQEPSPIGTLGDKLKRLTPDEYQAVKDTVNCLLERSLSKTQPLLDPD
jgi:hypothetical protein